MKFKIGDIIKIKTQDKKLYEAAGYSIIGENKGVCLFSQSFWTPDFFTTICLDYNEIELDTCFIWSEDEITKIRIRH